LVYISLSLKATPYLSLSGGRETEKVRETAARAANLYSQLLQDYVSNADMDSDAILLQGAGTQIRKAREDYDHAVASLADFVRRRGHNVSAAMSSLPASPSLTSPGTTGSGVTGGGTETPAETTAKELETLYAARAGLESEIQASEAALRTGDRLRADQLSD